jgi:hypothetical protein
MEPTMEAGVEPAGEAGAPLGPVVQIDEGLTHPRAPGRGSQVNSRGDVERAAGRRG